MGKYDEYFLMNANQAAEYAMAKIPEIGWDAATITSKEIGDGNLNYVFKVHDEKGHSAIIKQAGSALRISADMHLPVDRNRIESEILILQEKLAPGYVPHIYFYDTVMSACGMEDLSDHQLMRYALMEHKIFPLFADQISTFMVKTLLGSSDIVMNHKEKKELNKTFCNPDLCDLTEDVVYTDPYNDFRGLNHVYPPNAEFLTKELYEDEELHLEVAKLKMDFMTNAQSLIHGDLHTGSIFIKEDSTKVFDPEFAFYGPMGYDIGNVIANMIFAWCNGDFYGKKEFCGWVESVIVDVIDLTMSKMDTYFDENVTDVMAKTPGYKEYYLGTILADTAGVTGLELNRRIIGTANVKDITTIPDEAGRVRAERICVLAAKRFIKERAQLKNGADFLAILKDAIAKA
ncbi:MAG: S-methyl-5-thioribose kinase [Lachnospiraceae bacterium]|nr:S-methyl-5-thioribose kinase [Lachnospiraceae bacterium]